MKKFFPTLLLSTALLTAGVHAADDIVFIDIQEVFKNFYRVRSGNRLATSNSSARRLNPN